MDIVLKGLLQGSIPVVVFVGGAHHLTKKLKASKPVLYYGSLLAGLGLAYAVVEGKIKAPFMNAEEDDLYYCSKCDEGFSSINPTDEGQFCDSCLPSSATLHDEMERITMEAETFEAQIGYDGAKRYLRGLSGRFEGANDEGFFPAEEEDFEEMIIDEIGEHTELDAETFNATQPKDSELWEDVGDLYATKNQLFEVIGTDECSMCNEKLDYSYYSYYSLAYKKFKPKLTDESPVICGECFDSLTPNNKIKVFRPFKEVGCRCPYCQFNIKKLWKDSPYLLHGGKSLPKVWVEDYEKDYPNLTYRDNYFGDMEYDRCIVCEGYDFKDRNFIVFHRKPEVGRKYVYPSRHKPVQFCKSCWVNNYYNAESFEANAKNSKKINLTEKEFLVLILVNKDWVDNKWEDGGASFWHDEMDMKKMRGVLSSLVKKGIITANEEFVNKNKYTLVHVNDKYTKDDSINWNMFECPQIDSWWGYETFIEWANKVPKKMVVSIIMPMMDEKNAETFEADTLCQGHQKGGSCGEKSTGQCMNCGTPMCDEMFYYCDGEWVCYSCDKMGFDPHDDDDDWDAETFNESVSLFEIKIPADSYDSGPDAELRSWIRSMQQKGYTYIIRKGKTGVMYDEEGNKFWSPFPEYLIYDIRDKDEITYDMERDLTIHPDLMIYGSKKMERVFINYDATMRGYGYVKPAIGGIAEYIPVMDYETFEKTFD